MKPIEIFRESSTIVSLSLSPNTCESVLNKLYTLLSLPGLPPQIQPTQEKLLSEWKAWSKTLNEVRRGVG